MRASTDSIDTSHTRKPVPVPPGMPVKWRLPPSDERDPAKVEHALRERIKELNCLYAVAQLAERYPGSLDELLHGVVNVLPPSWQYPETTCARITFKGRAFVSDPFRATRWCQRSEIAMYGTSAGSVEVFYTKRMPDSYEGPFLREERALLDGVAEHLGLIATRMAAERELKDTNRQLTIQRQTLQETNTALRTVLSRIEDEKREIHRDIQANVEKVLTPIVDVLALRTPRGQRNYINMLRDNLADITSPFVNELARNYHSLTPTEIRICKMIRDGLRTKEIAQIRGVSPATVNRHREHIRRKLGIANQSVNLTTHLQATM
jgi:DNA-binding CsgD family transcriptional regulator